MDQEPLEPASGFLASNFQSRHILIVLLTGYFLSIGFSNAFGLIWVFRIIGGWLWYSYGYLYAGLAFGDIRPICANILRERNAWERMKYREWFWRQQCEGNYDGIFAERRVISSVSFGLRIS